MRQGSILLPTLFLIVMDEMLRVMTTRNSGVSIAGLYLGTSAHADDVRSLSQTVAAAENQTSTLAEFTINRGLKINANKTEIVALSRGHHTPSLSLTIAGTPVSIKKEAKCLGYCWQSNLGAGKSVEANIEKGRKAFFNCCRCYWGLTRLPEPPQCQIYISHLCYPCPSLWL